MQEIKQTKKRSMADYLLAKRQPVAKKCDGCTKEKCSGFKFEIYYLFEDGSREKDNTVSD